MTRKLALVGIMRDAQDCVSRMFESAVRWVDAVHWTDTGSVDDTVKIAESYGAVVTCCTPQTHPQHFFEDGTIADFAACRNFNLQALPAAITHFLWLDVDDELLGGEQLETLCDRLDAENMDGALLEYLYSFDSQGRCNTTHWRERIVRRAEGWKFCYPVHEALPPHGRRFARYDGIKVKHWRHERVNPGRSADRNLRILKARGDPEDERICFYMGLEHATAQQYDESIKWFEKYLAKSTVIDELYMAHHFLADLYRAKKEPEKSLQYDLQATLIRPGWKDAYHGLVQTFCELEDWERCLHYAELGLKASIPSTPFAVNPLHEAVGWISYYVRALAATGQMDTAFEWTQKALQTVPDNPDHVNNETVLAVSINHRRGVTAVRDAVEHFLRSDDAETAAIVLGRLPDATAQDPQLSSMVGLVGQAVTVGSDGRIPPDEWLDGFDARKFDTQPGPITDLRLNALIQIIAKRPDWKQAAILGGPPGLDRTLLCNGIMNEVFAKIPVDRPSGSYDLVILMGCLERVQFPDRVLTEAKRLVRPGGALLVTVPDGPAYLGVRPPLPENVRLRSYTLNSYRVACGTWRIPDAIARTHERAGHLIGTLLVYGESCSPRRIAIVCPAAPEPWGPKRLETGIGGSEEMAIRLGRAWARRGHDVTVYGSGWLGTDFTSDYAVAYKALEQYTPSDVLIGWRSPLIFVNQVRPLEAGYKILWLHDSTPKDAVALAAPQVDAVWCISRYQAGLYAGLPHIIPSRNGIDPEEFDVPGIRRDPRKLVYLSSPFRGLDRLLAKWNEIWQRAPGASLHAYYGFQSADRMGMAEHPLKQQMLEGLQQIGVVWHDRIGQTELAREILSAGVWSYSVSWNEESCLAGMKAQAGGAVPVTYPMGALPETIAFGELTDEPRFVDAVLRAVHMSDPERQAMMRWARQVYPMSELAQDWENRWRGRWVP